MIRKIVLISLIFNVTTYFELSEASIRADLLADACKHAFEMRPTYKIDSKILDSQSDKFEIGSRQLSTTVKMELRQLSNDLKSLIKNRFNVNFNIKRFGRNHVKTTFKWPRIHHQ